MRIRARAPWEVAGTVPKRVLVVDDTVDVGEALADLLQCLGFLPVVVESAKAARAAVEADAYDVIVSDLAMPHETGFDLARWLRSHPDPCVRDIPAIAVSALCSGDARREARESGFVGFVAKPYAIADIRYALTAALADRQPPARLRPPVR